MPGLKKNFFLTISTPQNRESLHCLFWPGIAIDRAWSNYELIGREPLIFARVENGVTKFSPKRQKTPKFSKKIGSGKQFSVGNFHFFGRGKTNFFGGGYNFKTG